MADEMGDTEPQKTDSAGQALLKLVNVLYDTDENKLPQLTRLTRREVFPMSLQMMKEQVFNKDRIKVNDDGTITTIPLTKIWRNGYMQLLRSVDKWYFMLGAGLAHEQASAEAEKADEEMEL